MYFELPIKIALQYLNYQLPWPEISLYLLLSQSGNPILHGNCFVPTKSISRNSARKSEISFWYPQSASWTITYPFVNPSLSNESCLPPLQENKPTYDYLPFINDAGRLFFLIFSRDN